MHRTVQPTDTSQKYNSPQVKVLSISARSHILAASTFGEPGVNNYNEGSSSSYGFGGDE